MYQNIPTQNESAYIQLVEILKWSVEREDARAEKLAQAMKEEAQAIKDLAYEVNKTNTLLRALIMKAEL